MKVFFFLHLRIRGINWILYHVNDSDKEITAIATKKFRHLQKNMQY